MTNLGRWADRLLQKRNYDFINRFSECWIPDEEGNNNLAGELSHPFQMPKIKINYIGHLSRLTKKDAGQQAGHLLIILSGPEPQRTLLEEKIIRDIVHYNGTATVVRGLPGNARIIPSTNTIRFYNHLGTEDLNIEMNKAEFIISRSGYSTIMDISEVGKRSILIPTPGQTEQLYLAQHLYRKRMALYVSQKTFTLSTALQQARSFDYAIENEYKTDRLSPVISQLVQALQKH
jgi:hypothetical protein